MPRRIGKEVHPFSQRDKATVGTPEVKAQSILALFGRKTALGLRRHSAERHE
jgi:hypothetical protein